MIVDIRHTYALPLAQRNQEIESIRAGRNLVCVSISRKARPSISFASGVLIPATRKGLTANRLNDVIALIGNGAIRVAGNFIDVDAGGEIDRVSVSLPNGEFVEWYPTSRTYRVWRDGMPIWESINGNVCGDSTILADTLC
jgi:hypothetical protein